MPGMGTANADTASADCRRFLITGAKGFIGAWIVKNLVERGSSPVIFDLDTEWSRLRSLLRGDQLEQVVFCRGDVTSLEDLEGAVAENSATHLIHLAAL